MWLCWMDFILETLYQMAQMINSRQLQWILLQQFFCLIVRRNFGTIATHVFSHRITLLTYHNRDIWIYVIYPLSPFIWLLMGPIAFLFLQGLGQVALV